MTPTSTIPNFQAASEVIDDSQSQAQSQSQSQSQSQQNQEKPALVGKTFLKNIWYFAVSGKTLQPGKMVRKIIANEQIMIGRDSEGQPFALNDICPHQAVPFTAGKFDGREVECPFHGWRFGTNGVCTNIPSLCHGQNMNIKNIKTRTYPCREVQGNIWVFVGNKTENLPEVPMAPGLEGYKYDQTTTTLILPNHIDYNAIALVDTAHVPYVHKSWWWRNSRSMKEKTKQYIPSETGWTMVRHKPSKHSITFKLLADFMQTEISFRLPCCRREYITLNDRTFLAGLTCLTPIDENTTELNHTTFWTVPGVGPLVTPIIQYFVKVFLGQDEEMARLQRECLKANPQLIVTIRDAGTPGRWYFDLKREWTEADNEGRPFVNPIKASTLRWKT